MKSKNNPHKANQYKPDPRQSLFLANYINPTSNTFGNCFQSAVKAGYEEEYAKVLMGHMPTWLSEKVKDNHMIEKAESNLQEFLDLPLEKDFAKVKLDATKFSLERLKKEKYGKEPDEIKDQTLIINHINFNYGEGKK